MPLYKCSECHHEWEGREKPCDWCKAEGCIMLAPSTPLEDMIRSGRMKEYVKNASKRK